MSLSYLDKTGLAALWAKIKAFVAEVDEKVDNIRVRVKNNSPISGTLIATISVTKQDGTYTDENIRIPLNVPLIGSFDRVIGDQPQSPYLQYDLPRGVFAGHLTGSSKDIYFFVPTPYDYTDESLGRSAFLSGAGAIRGISGYVDATSFNISEYKYNHDGQQTNTKRFTIDFERGGILIMLHNENGFKTTASTPAAYPNNTPVSVYFSNFKLNIPY
jgi:hypothetical protein